MPHTHKIHYPANKKGHLSTAWVMEFRRAIKLPLCHGVFQISTTQTVAWFSLALNFLHRNLTITAQLLSINVQLTQSRHVEWQRMTRKFFNLMQDNIHFSVYNGCTVVHSVAQHLRMWHKENRRLVNEHETWHTYFRMWLSIPKLNLYPTLTLALTRTLYFYEPYIHDSCQSQITAQLME